MKPSRFFMISLIVGASVTAPSSAVSQDLPQKGYRAEFFQVLASAEGDFVALAEAMPEQLYTWRPGEGVRSYGEVCLHIAMTNFSGPRMIGATLPAGLEPGGYEQSITKKAEIVAELKRSFDHLRSAVLSISDSEADTEIAGWYGPTTYRGALHIMNEHLGEHLGQSIAYARVNSIVPPWNR